MKRVLLLLPAVVLLASCSSSSHRNTPTKAASSQPTTPRARFIALIHTEPYTSTGELDGYDEVELVNAGKSSCEDFGRLRSDESRSEAASTLIRNLGWTAATASAVVKAASTTLC